MIIYNITLKITPSLADEWVLWQKEEHIPEIMNTGLFTSFTMSRLLDIDDTEGPTFITQFFADTYEDYQQYIDEHAPRLRVKAFEKWGDGFIAFRSVLQTVK